MPPQCRESAATVLRECRHSAARVPPQCCMSAAEVAATVPVEFGCMTEFSMVKTFDLTTNFDHEITILTIDHGTDRRLSVAMVKFQGVMVILLVYCKLKDSNQAVETVGDYS